MRLTHTSKEYLRLSFAILCCYFLVSCVDEGEHIQEKPTDTQSLQTSESDQQHSALSDIQSIHPSLKKLSELIDGYSLRLVDSAQSLQEQLIQFTKTPSQDALEKTIELLAKTHNLYTSGDSLRSCCFFEIAHTPVKDSQTKHISLFAKLDQYPLLPGYLDTVEGYPYSGLIHADIPISQEAMEEEFQLGDPHYVTLGFHALDVMLRGSSNTRQANDFHALSSTKDTGTAPPELRRTLYIILLASQIRTDLSKLNATWQANLQNQLTKQTSDQADAFLAQLYLDATKELEDTRKKLKDNTITDKHLNQSVLKEKEALLMQILAIKD